VLLFRRAGADLAKTEILDLKGAMRAPGSERNIDLQPGDVLIVPQNVVSKIERYIKWGNFGAYINPLNR
jgi:protein involved in polysaccharide export with SLBB domain